MSQAQLITESLWKKLKPIKPGGLWSSIVRRTTTNSRSSKEELIKTGSWIRVKKIMTVNKLPVLVPLNRQTMV